MEIKTEHVLLKSLMDGFNTFVDSHNLELGDFRHSISISTLGHIELEQLADYDGIFGRAATLASGSDIVDKSDASTWHGLVPITSTIGHGSTTHDWHTPIKAMSVSKEYFPVKNNIESNSIVSQLISLSKELQQVSTGDVRSFAETFLALLKKYASAIQAGGTELNDTSLYDYLKTSASLAVCLQKVEAKGCDGESPFLLVGADVSGIQSYIYQIVSKYAGKNLKGRSFYLRMLTDAIVRYLLSELDLCTANIVYNSGGGFYMIAPNTVETKKRLENALMILEKQLFKTHGTSLYVAIDYVELSEDMLLHKNGKNIGDAWGELFTKRDRKKSQKFSSIISKNYDVFFTPSSNGIDTKRDIISGEVIPSGEKVCFAKELKPLREINKLQIDLGKALKSANVIVITNEEIPFLADKLHINPVGLGYTYYIITKETAKKNINNLNGYKSDVTVLTLNGNSEECLFIPELETVDNIYSFEFYGGNETGSRYALTFEDMCDKHDETAFERLGVLRMDVDNLGHIFQQGISKERASLCRYSSLSGAFDYFFSGYLNTIWRETCPEQSFIIYSGGDDVFIVGSWDVTIELAKRIRESFRDFTCHNDEFSISGGVAIVDAKFPIMRGAEESAIEESNAKDHKCKGKEKDSISFMDMPMHWAEEFPQIEYLKNTILDAINSGTLPKSFISKVMSHYANAGICNHKITNIKTYWMLTYDISRFQQRTKDVALKDLMANLKAEICGSGNRLNGQPISTNYNPLELWSMACRWAELDYRAN